MLILISLIGIYYLSYKFEIIDKQLYVRVKSPYTRDQGYVVYKHLNKSCSGKNILLDKLEKNKLYIDCEPDVYLYKIGDKYMQIDEIYHDKSLDFAKYKSYAVGGIYMTIETPPTIPNEIKEIKVNEYTLEELEQKILDHLKIFYSEDFVNRVYININFDDVYPNMIGEYIVGMHFTLKPVSDYKDWSEVGSEDKLIRWQHSGLQILVVEEESDILQNIIEDLPEYDLFCVLVNEYTKEAYEESYVEAICTYNNLSRNECDNVSVDASEVDFTETGYYYVYISYFNYNSVHTIRVRKLEGRY